MIHFFSNEIPFQLSNKKMVKDWINTVVSSYGYKVGSINVIFCSDDYLLQINTEFLGHNYYTDIITFDYTEEKRIGGELYISIDTVKANACEYEQDSRKELLRVVIHGFLHLMGFDDHTPDDEAEIHRREDIALELFNFDEFDQQL